MLIPFGRVVGDFNQFEKIMRKSNWIISPSCGKNKQYLKPPLREMMFPTKAGHNKCGQVEDEKHDINQGKPSSLQKKWPSCANKKV